MLRVVLDTNVIVAAARSTRGASYALVEWVRSARVATVVSTALVLGYESLLRRQIADLGWSESDVSAFLDVMCDRSERISPVVRLRPSVPDVGDEFVVELAATARVDYLVTHNPRDFIGCEQFGVAVPVPGLSVRPMRDKPWD